MNNRGNWKELSLIKENISLVKSSRLVKSEDDWFLKMSVTQRENHMKRIANATVQPKKPTKGKRKVVSGEQSMSKESRVKRQLFSSESVVPFTSKEVAQVQEISDLTAGPSRSFQATRDPTTSEESVLSVTVKSFCKEVIIQEHVLDAIWKKAADLLRVQGAIEQAPGGSGFLVMSNSRPRPHLITVKKSGQYCCDSDCPNGQSLGICSHSVAAAEKASDLESFVGWFKRLKKHPNLTKLVTAQMPKGRGRKGGVAPPKKKHKVASVERVPFSRVCKLSQDGPSGTSARIGEFDDSFDDGTFTHGDSPPYNQASSSGGIPTHVRPSSISPTLTPQERLSHTLTISSGGSSHAYAGDRFLSHSVSLPRGTATSEGFISDCLPSAPPPLIPCAAVTSPVNSSPFVLTFISGNIRVCRGCRQKYIKPAVPPNDLCVRHQEWQEFTPSCTQRRFGNVYYHCNVACILSRCPWFLPSSLVIPTTVLVQLLPVHTAFLQKHMPGRLAYQ